MNRVKQPCNYHLKLLKHKKNIYSQHGEDGIIEAILRLLHVNKPQWCCEFGAWDGKHLSNTFNLVKNKSWKAVLIEADNRKFKKLLQTKAKFPNIIAHNETVHYLPGEGVLLDDILASTPIPADFCLLSIDVDGPDYHIWESLKQYRPKIVIIEHNGIDGHIIQREGAVHKKDIDGSTSFWPMRELGESKGYRLLLDTGNLIFIDSQCLG